MVSADVVTADGCFLTASEREHEGLFWALRGGGGDLGVLTSLEYRLHPVETIYGARCSPSSAMRVTSCAGSGGSSPTRRASSEGSPRSRSRRRSQGTFAREIDDRTDRSEASAAPYSPRTQLFETTFLSLYVTKTATPWYSGQMSYARSSRWGPLKSS